MKKHLISIIPILFAGCVQPVIRGVVVAPEEGRTAQVCLGGEEVSVGDIFTHYRTVCSTNSLVTRSTRTYRPMRSCTKKSLGTATISKVVDDCFSMATFSGDSEIREGDVIEKKKEVNDEKSN